MKDNTKHIAQRIKAALLMLTFIIPLAISFGHSLHGHEHFDTCKVSSDTHVHDNDVDCQLGDIQIVKVGHYAFAKAYSAPTNFYTKPFTHYITASYTPITDTPASRGPPVC